MLCPFLRNIIALLFPNISLIYFLWFILAAAPNITCPPDVVFEESNISRMIEISGYLPVNVTSGLQTQRYGFNGTSTHLSVPWPLGSDPRLILGQNVSITWNVSYGGVECSSVTNKSSVLANCTMIHTSSSCTTNVLKFSKSQP